VPLTAAFPRSLLPIADVVARLVPTAIEPIGAIAVEVDGEVVTLPGRIYAPEVPTATVAALAPAEALALHCLYTRHHDGFIRAHHLEPVLTSDAPWAVPFVVQLIGEYVVEIVATIARTLDLGPTSADRERYGRFITANPRYFEATASRVVSYWDCYHRDQYPRLAEYPGSILIARLRAAARGH
jgi:hypothetical protein